jgi:hypothetical protein
VFSWRERRSVDWYEFVSPLSTVTVEVRRCCCRRLFLRVVSVDRREWPVKICGIPMRKRAGVPADVWLANSRSSRLYAVSVVSTKRCLLLMLAVPGLKESGESGAVPRGSNILTGFVSFGRGSGVIESSPTADSRVNGDGFCVGPVYAAVCLASVCV